MNSVLAIMAGSLVAEDLALAAAAGLWASGKLALVPAFLATFLGIGLGDLGLYALGRTAGPRLGRRRWPGTERIRSLALSSGVGSPSFVALARVIPGGRLTGYTAAGVFGAPLGPFAAAVTLSALAWVALWFGLAGPLAGHVGMAGLFCVLLAGLALSHWVAKGFQGREWKLRQIDIERLRWAEFWPAWLFYAPVAANALWLGFRLKGLRLPTLSNPGISNGGIINESKAEIFRLLPDHESVLPWALYEPGSRPQGGAFPLIAKPDAGQRGSGVRLIRSQAELDAYAEAADFRFLTQAYCTYPNEAGVFYVRRPGEPTGSIFSITRKVFPAVTGDGASTLAELILRSKRDRNMARVFFRRHAECLDGVIPRGERVRLVESGNHSQGCVFLDGQDLMGDGLLQAIDAIATAMPGFFVGRFDLRYSDDASFSAGRGFKIIEINGASSEATHIYDPSLGVGEVYRTLFRQWRIVFEIGAENRRLGLRPTPWIELWHALRDYRRSSRRHPLAS